MAGTPTRKRLTPEARRAVIEQAATEVFAERGYHAASVDEIARRSGISVPVLYDHFASKQDLHRRLLERHYAELRDLWYELAAHKPKPRYLVGRDARFAMPLLRRFPVRLRDRMVMSSLGLTKDVFASS